MGTVVTVRLNEAQERELRERLRVPEGSLGAAVKAALVSESVPAPRAEGAFDVVEEGKKAYAKQARGEELTPGEVLAMSKVPFRDRPGYKDREAALAELRKAMARE